MIALPLLAALAVGAVIGLFGSGGGILAVPAFVLLGLEAHDAVAASLLVVASAAVVALIGGAWRNARWGIAGTFAILGAPAAMAGAAIGRGIPGPYLLLGVAVLAAAAAVAALRRKTEAGDEIRCSTGSTAARLRCWAPSALAAIGVGFLTGLLGVGGGFLLTPVLLVAMRLPLRAAAATSLPVIAVNSLAGLAQHGEQLLRAGATGVPLALLAVAAVVGSLAAARLGGKIPPHALQRAFIVLLAAVGAGTAVVGTAGLLA
ncbi:sulfite exporter TauE/SafE family protein [Sinomonas notoginsengisoli]|uniref:sulfite exporter TauE/SafE family protein n=1 Tax=Sinomonas notoginsengisoli TaxID=1457311 RepID=UPI001F317C1B|nr:sulfite exporter TauE/SafE family protein [Sinomonas notoginsengisoli]